MHPRGQWHRALPLLLVAAPAFAEPTEAEMRTAIEQHAVAATEENRPVQKLGEADRDEQDPASAIQGLSQFIGSGGQGAMQFELKPFRKRLGAGQRSYVCDYAFRFDSNNPMQQQGPLAYIMQGRVPARGSSCRTRGSGSS